MLILALLVIFKTINKSMNNVTMTIKEGTLTKTSATYILESKSKYSCGESYSIDKEEKEEWKTLTQISPHPFTLIGMLPGEDGKLEFKIDWSKRYGELENGRYRIVKSVYINGEQREIYVEFTIE